MAAEPQLNLTHAQRKIVKHFGQRQFFRKQAECEKYFQLVAKELRTIPRLTDQHVVAAAIEATTIAKHS